MSFPIRAVVFDWAGTVVDFGCMAPVAALMGVLNAEGVAITAAQARRDMGRAKRDHVAALLYAADVMVLWQTAKGAPPTENDVDRVYAALGPAMTDQATRCAELIPGVADVVARLKARGVRIGSGTGYTREMMADVLKRAAAQGYAPEITVCAGETPSGRPAPLMTWKALIALDAWPASVCVKVDDAPVGIEEGRAAGCWTVGVTGSGNEVGLDLAAYRQLSAAERDKRIAAAGETLRAADAHEIVETVAHIEPALERIAARIAAGERPDGVLPR